MTKFIEEAVNTVEGVRHIESTSQEGLSNIVVQFNIGVPTLNASQDIRGKVAAIRGELPREIDEPIIQRIDPASTPIVSVAVNAPDADAARRVRHRRQAGEAPARERARRRRGEPGRRGEARDSGGRRSHAARSRTGLSLAAGRRRARARRTSMRPSGTADRGATEAMVRVAARGTSAAQIARHSGEARRRAHDARARRRAGRSTASKRRRSLAFVNDRPAIALDVQKQAGANTVGVADGVREAVARMRPSCRPASRCRWCATTRRSSASRSRTCR